MENKKGSSTIEEAERNFKEANKAIKTGIFNWSADYLEGSMKFERAAKLFKTLGNKEKALQAYLKYSMCSEKINENFGAAEGLMEAAFLEKDKRKSLDYLHLAQNYYKIQGSSNKGQESLKKFAQKMLDSEDPEAQQFALNIFQKLFEEVFEGDNFLWNPDIVNEYIQLLMKHQEYSRVIEAKYSLIKHLKSAGQIDHQIRRSYLEIVCVQIVSEDFSNIEKTLDKFTSDFGGNAYSHDEFKLAIDMHEAVKEKNYKQIEVLCKKPMFSFLEIEIVRTIKKWAMNKAEISATGGVASNVTGQDKQRILDNLML